MARGHKRFSFRDEQAEVATLVRGSKTYRKSQQHVPKATPALDVHSQLSLQAAEIQALNAARETLKRRLKAAGESIDALKLESEVSAAAHSKMDGQVQDMARLLSASQTARETAQAALADMTTQATAAAKHSNLLENMLHETQQRLRATELQRAEQQVQLSGLEHALESECCAHALTLERESQVTAALAAQQHRSSINAAALAASQQQVEDSRAQAQLLHSQLEAAEKAMRKLQAAAARSIAHLQRQNDSILLQLQQQRASGARAMLESQAAKFAAARMAAKVGSLQMQLQQWRQHAEQLKTVAVEPDASMPDQLLQGTQQPSVCAEQELMTTCESLQQQQQQQLDACDTTTTPSQCQMQVAAADSAAALLTEDQQQQQHSAAVLAASQQQVEDSRAEVELLHSQIEAAEKAMCKLQAASAHATAHLQRQNDSSLLQLQQQRASAARAMLESRAAKFAAARMAAKANSLEARLQQSRLHAEQQKVAADVTTAALEAEQQQHSSTAEKLHTSQEQLRQMEAALMQLQCGAASTQQALLKLQRTSANSITKLQQQVDIAQHKEQRQRKVVASLVRCAAEAAAARFSVARLTAEKCSLQAQLPAAPTYRSSEQTAQQEVTGYQQSTAQATEALCQAALQQAGVAVCLSDTCWQQLEGAPGGDQGVKVHNSSDMKVHAGQPAVQRTQHVLQPLTETSASCQPSTQQVAPSMHTALPRALAAPRDSFAAAATAAVAPRLMSHGCCSARGLRCGSTTILCSRSTCMTTCRCSCTTSCAGACTFHYNSASSCACQHVSSSPDCDSISPVSSSPVDQLQHSRQWGSGRTSETRCSTEDSCGHDDQQDCSSNSDTEEGRAAADCGCGAGTTSNSLGKAVGGESCDMEDEAEEEEEMFFDAWDDGMGPCAV